jgi:hypothetical protein
VGDPEKPIADHLTGNNGSRLTDEDEEGGLKSVFGVMVMVEDTTAHAPDHRAVPANKGGEGCFVPLLDEAPQELAIGQSTAVLEQRCPTKVL